MSYLRGTPKLPLTLCTYRTNILKWWVYGYHGVYPNCRGQTGENHLLGKGSNISTSPNKKLNTRIYTEKYLVAADDIMPHSMWTRYFWIIKDTR